MSHDSDIEESPLSLGEIVKIGENNYLMTMGLSDAEDATAAVLQRFTQPFILPSRPERTSTSEVVDSHVNRPSTRSVNANQNCLGLPASTLGRSPSDASRSATPSSSVGSRDDKSDTVDFDILGSIWERSHSETSRSATPESSDRPREEADTINFELPGSTCGRSLSGESRSDSPDSSLMFSWLAEPDNLFLRYYERGVFLLWGFRKKGYLIPFELIWLALTITSCYMGAYYWPMCPADEYLPKYVFFNGAIATFSLCVEIMDNLWKLLLHSSNGVGRYFCAFVVGWIAIITTLVEMIEFYTMSYSFHRSDENYCNETFYWFVFYKNIAFGVLMSLTALIYIPSFNYNYFMLNDLD